MNYHKTLFILFFVLSVSYSSNKINYLEPKPGAILVSTGNSIVLGFEEKLNLTESELSGCIVVSGSKSSFHSGLVALAEDNKKAIFKPDAPFDLGEKITVKLNGRLLRAISRGGESYSYSFITRSRNVNMEPVWRSGELKDNFQNGNGKNFDPVVPQLIVTIDNNPAPGDLFLAPFSYSTYLMILNNQGNLYWSSIHGAFGGDFKVQPNGNLTFFDGDMNKHYEMDQNYNFIDTFYCGNGYTTDIHELRVLSNGHALVLAYDPEIVNMGIIVNGGDTNATVVGLIIQEVDQHHNVVFQWRSWDHFEITDAWHQNMDSSFIDAVHGNAIEIDNDGNLIISSRHLDEITKINRTTGEIMWRLGGKNNQFTFLGDTLKFTYQHAVRRISNGHLTLFDNGNFHSPQYSRAVEYSLDEVNKTATRVWQYRHTPDIYGYWGGYVQRLANGNTLICWGGTTPTITEVQPNGTIAFEGTFSGGIYTYRAYKFDWSGPPVSIKNGHDVLPSSYKLKNYPNPFNPSTNISYDIPNAGFVNITVFDILGKQIAVLVNEKQSAGSFSVKWDAANFPSGIYLYKITSGSFSETRKMILLK